MADRQTEDALASLGLCIGDSLIDGRGIFTVRPITKGTKVVPWPSPLGFNRERDGVGGFNYLADGNLTYRKTGKFANRDIDAGEELTVKTSQRWLAAHYHPAVLFSPAKPQERTLGDKA